MAGVNAAPSGEASTSGRVFVRWRSCRFLVTWHDTFHYDEGQDHADNATLLSMARDYIYGFHSARRLTEGCKFYAMSFGKTAKSASRCFPRSVMNMTRLTASYYRHSHETQGAYWDMVPTYLSQAISTDKEKP